ncbi:putative phosphoribosyltransferase [Archaeoglobus sulfaticallidus PM70-1]|uniref:Putative phosphoribosyltransferase n=1 Tax=Archaeoglobus sulfaticallidus PM70-1 TaxID=387631 RepID=N0BGE3_9EURY|nr:phosphoribosyltransferase [Archaeoglobus sulfaticallidus]AGK62058.1 putative phosphoribosyltransferase [Archaeoglobus sulfaticallidus PM70-1]
MEVECQLLTWDHIYRVCFTIAKDVRKSGFKPDAIVAVGRGGWIPARIISDFLNIRELYSVKAEYWDVAESRDDAVITQPINVDMSGKKVLLVDDVADTGKTLNVVVSHLRKAGAREIKTAVLQYKKTSEFIPDFSGEIFSRWVWIVYPWGLTETAIGFLKKIDNYKEKSTDELIDEIKRRFNLTLSKEIIELAKELIG